MHALVCTRKGDLQQVIVDASETTLKARGDALNGKPLQWQAGWFGGWGALGDPDEESSYEIVKVTP